MIENILTETLNGVLQTVPKTIIWLFLFIIILIKFFDLILKKRKFPVVNKNDIFGLKYNLFQELIYFIIYVSILYIVLKGMCFILNSSFNDIFEILKWLSSEDNILRKILLYSFSVAMLTFPIVWGFCKKYSIKLVSTILTILIMIFYATYFNAIILYSFQSIDNEKYLLMSNAYDKLDYHYTFLEKSLETDDEKATKINLKDKIESLSNSKKNWIKEELRSKKSKEKFEENLKKDDFDEIYINLNEQKKKMKLKQEELNDIYKQSIILVQNYEELEKEYKKQLNCIEENKTSDKTTFHLAYTKFKTYQKSFYKKTASLKVDTSLFEAFKKDISSKNGFILCSIPAHLIFFIMYLFNINLFINSTSLKKPILKCVDGRSYRCTYLENNKEMYYIEDENSIGYFIKKEDVKEILYMDTIFIGVKDLSESLGFYKKVFEIEKTKEESSEDTIKFYLSTIYIEIYIMKNLGEETLHRIKEDSYKVNLKKYLQVNPIKYCVDNTQNLNVLKRKIINNGGSILKEPKLYNKFIRNIIKWDSEMEFKDPDGYTFKVIKRK